MTDPQHPSDHEALEEPPLILGDEHEDGTIWHEGGRRKKRVRRLPGCLAALVALAVVLGGAYVAVTRGFDYLSQQFADPADYAGPGTGSVLFQVHSGDSVAAIGQGLEDKGVVASVDAFTEAAGGHQDIQVGFYQLKKKMKASDAYAILSNPDNILTSQVTVPEGLTVDQIVTLLADKTDFSRSAFEKVLKDPRQLGLPSYAKGNPEGYLFPATYGFGPKEKPVDMLKDMVTQWKVVSQETGLEKAAADVGRTPGELMTVASLVEAEARGGDMAKVARVIYNRLDDPTGPTIGRLQIDATVNYALGRNLGVGLTEQDLKVDSPYNTYIHAGLPPTPIEAPGKAAIEAAAHPASGDWLFYVTVNLRTGETKFTKSYNQFLRYKQQLQTYCETSDAC